MLKVSPGEVVTDAAPVYPGVLEELVPAAWHHVERYANNELVKFLALAQKRWCGSGLGEQDPLP
jgi:hypothetical protein